MINASQYRADSAGLHHAYFLQFATKRTAQEILNAIGIKALLASEDGHLNDVKLPFNNMSSGGGWWWDTVDINIERLKEAGACYSKSTHTCIGKAMAHELIIKARGSV